MSLKQCECCLKPMTACECLGPRQNACDFCGKPICINQAFYESAAYRLLEGGPEECGSDSVVVSCEDCEVIRMAAIRFLKKIRRLIRKFQ